MARHILVVVLVVLLGFQVNGDQNYEDVWIEARIIYGQLQTTVLKSVTSALSSVLTLIESLRTTERTQADRSQTLITAAYNDLLLKVKALKDQAAKANVDVLQCTDRLEVRLRRIPEKVQLEIGACLEQNANQGIEIVEAAVTRLQKSQAVVNGLGTKIDLCVDVVDEGECLYEVIDEIRLRLTELPLTVSEETSKTNNLVAIIQQTYVACVTNRYVDVKTQGSQLVANMTTCVTDVIDKSKSTTTKPTTRPI